MHADGYQKIKMLLGGNSPATALSEAGEPSGSETAGLVNAVSRLTECASVSHVG